jgi:hypothetical protein
MRPWGPARLLGCVRAQRYPADVSRYLSSLRGELSRLSEEQQLSALRARNPANVSPLTSEKGGKGGTAAAAAAAAAAGVGVGGGVRASPSSPPPGSPTAEDLDQQAYLDALFGKDPGDSLLGDESSPTSTSPTSATANEAAAATAASTAAAAAPALPPIMGARATSSSTATTASLPAVHRMKSRRGSSAKLRQPGFKHMQLASGASAAALKAKKRFMQQRPTVLYDRRVVMTAA